MPASNNEIPLVSIIVPVFNAEPFLADCLKSILDQTVCDIEVVCVNDGSTDQSLKILQEYGSKDSRIKFANKANEGVSVARNEGVVIATGDYLMFVDADDWVEPDFCEMPYQMAQQTQAEIVSFNFCRSSEKWRSGTGEVRDSRSDQSVPNAIMKSIAEMLIQIPVTPVTKMWSRAFWLAHHLSFPAGLGMGEDQVVHWVGLLEAKRVVHIDQALYHYRTNPMSATNNGCAHCMDIVAVYALIKDYLVKTARYDAYKSPYLYAKLTMLRLCYIKINSELRNEFSRKLLSSLTEDEWCVIQKGCLLSLHIRNFYKALNGEWFARILERAVTAYRLIRNRLIQVS